MIIYFILLIFALFAIYFYIQKKRIEKRIKISARLISGKTIEKLLPFFKNFKYNPHDLRFVGDPIDYIIFDGYSEGKIKQIVFLEIKSGKSKLSKIQNEIKEMIEKRKVKWEELKIKN